MPKILQRETELDSAISDLKQRAASLKTDFSNMMVIAQGLLSATTRFIDKQETERQSLKLLETIMDTNCGGRDILDHVKIFFNFLLAKMKNCGADITDVKMLWHLHDSQDVRPKFIKAVNFFGFGTQDLPDLRLLLGITYLLHTDMEKEIELGKGDQSTANGINMWIHEMDEWQIKDFLNNFIKATKTNDIDVFLDKINDNWFTFGNSITKNAGDCTEKPDNENYKKIKHVTDNFSGKINDSGENNVKSDMELLTSTTDLEHGVTKTQEPQINKNNLTSRDSYQKDDVKSEHDVLKNNQMEGIGNEIDAEFDNAAECATSNSSSTESSTTITEGCFEQELSLTMIQEDGAVCMDQQNDNLEKEVEYFEAIDSSIASGKLPKRAFGKHLGKSLQTWGVDDNMRKTITKIVLSVLSALNIGREEKTLSIVAK